MRFRAAVAAYGQKLRGSEYLNNTSWQQIKQWAEQAKGVDPQGYRAEFIRLIELADGVDLTSVSDDLANYVRPSTCLLTGRIN